MARATLRNEDDKQKVNAQLKPSVLAVFNAAMIKSAKLRAERKDTQAAIDAARAATRDAGIDESEEISDMDDSDEIESSILDEVLDEYLPCIGDSDDEDDDN